MNVRLTPVEARIIGSLMEKSMTTPDQYPLSLNALVNACNQKSSREPVMDLSEGEVADALEALQRRYLVRERSGFGGRVPKYHYRLYNDEIGEFRFSESERAVVCLLLLRGPQTAGELRSRAGRMHEFTGTEQVEETLDRLMRHEQGPFVIRLGREPGRREARYAQLFCGDVAEPAPRESPAPRPAGVAPAALEGSLEQRVAVLEQRVAALEAALAARAEGAAGNS